MSLVTEVGIITFNNISKIERLLEFAEWYLEGTRDWQKEEQFKYDEDDVREGEEVVNKLKEVITLIKSIRGQ